MTDSVLIVDDDTNLLRAYERRFRSRYRLECAEGGAEGLVACRERGPFAVVISDRQMPGMDGVEFLARLRELCPDTVRVMLTGGATLDSAADAVNTGQIFRFLLKPCPLETLGLAIEAGIGQYRLVTAERELLTKTLSGSVKVLTDVLSLVNPTAFGRSARVRTLVRRLIGKMRVDHAWQCEIAAMLSQVGCVMVSEETLAKAYGNTELADEELRSFNAHPVVGRDLIAKIPRLEGVAEIIAYQNKRFDGDGPPCDARRGTEIPLGARILKVALDFDTLSSTHATEADAVAKIVARSGWYDPEVVEALRSAIGMASQSEVRLFPIAELPDSAVLAEDVCTQAGKLLIARGQEVTLTLRALLLRNAESSGVRQPIRVMLPAATPAAVESSVPLCC